VEKWKGRNQIFCSTFLKSGKSEKVEPNFIKYFAPLFLKVEKWKGRTKYFAPLFLKVEKWIGGNLIFNIMF